MTDPALTEAEREAAWEAVEQVVDRLAASTAELSADERRALIAGAAFYVRCLEDGAYEPELVEPVLEAALRVARASDVDEHFATLVYHSARLRIARAETGRARELLDAHLPGMAQAGPPELAWCLLLRGTIERLEARPIEAQAWLAQARDALRPAKHPTHRVLAPSVHAELASTWLDLGVPELAASCIAEQRDAARGATDPVLVHALGLQEARLEFVSGRYASARQLARDAVASQQQEFVGWSRIRAQYRLVEGLAACELGVSDRSAMERARDLLRDACMEPELSRVERVESMLALFSARLRLGDRDGAQTALQRAGAELSAVATQDATRTPTTLQSVRLVASRARWARTSGAPTEQLVVARDALRAAWTEFLAMWNRTPVQQQGIGFLQVSFRRFVPGELIEIELAADPSPAGVERAFAVLLEAQASGTLARTLDVGVPTLDALRRELLTPGETILALLPAPDRSHAFLLDQRRLLHAALPDGEILQQAQRAFARDLLSRPVASAPASPPSAASLAGLLFPEAFAAAIASSKRLTFTGFEILGVLPAAALDVRGVGVLGLAKEITELPSLPIGVRLAQRAREAARASDVELLVVAAPSIAEPTRALWDELDELPWTAADARKLGGGHGPDRVQLITGGAATAAALASRRARVLSVLTHGVQDARRSPSATLVLAPRSKEDDGTFGVDDVARVFGSAPTPPIVVLASCGASRAPMRRGDDGANHLGGAFLARETWCVLLSSADLDDDATRAILEVVHAALLRGATPSAALFEARRAVAANERWKHAHYHALLGASGLGHHAPEKR